jgi:hypothetical protein
MQKIMNQKELVMGIWDYFHLIFFTLSWNRQIVLE